MKTSNYRIERPLAEACIYAAVFAANLKSARGQAQSKALRVVRRSIEKAQLLQGCQPFSKFAIGEGGLPRQMPFAVEIPRSSGRISMRE
jgi:hypothetical protein